MCTLWRISSCGSSQRSIAAADDYRIGKVLLAEPVTLLKQHFAVHPNAYITDQVYLDRYSDGALPGSSRR